MSTERPADDERDPWLREALRHAPDADAAPPPAVREAILAQARAQARGATAPAAPPTRPAGWRAAWAWLGQPRLAAALASVMVATLAGVLWWDRPLDETLQRPPQPAATTVSPSAAPPVAAPAPDPALNGARAPSLGQPPVTTQAEAAAATPMPRRMAKPSTNPDLAESRSARPDADKALAKMRADSAPNPFPPGTPVPPAQKPAEQQRAPMGAAQPAAKSAEREAVDSPSRSGAGSTPVPTESRRSQNAAAAAADKAEAPVTPPAAAMPAPPPRDRREAPAAARADTRERTAAAGADTRQSTATARADTRDAAAAARPETLDGAAAARAEPRDGAASARNGAREAAAPAPFAAGRLAAAPAREPAAAVGPSSLRGLRAAIDAQPQRWTWQRGGAVQPMGPALQRWLQQLDAATDTRWTAAAVRPPQPGAMPLRLFRDGTLQATLWVDAAGVALGNATPPSATARAGLDADAAGALARTLDDVAP